MSKKEAPDYNDILAAIVGAVGKNDEVSEVSRWFPTGFQPLDQCLSGRVEDGGLPSGRIIEIAGPPSSGKTWIATQVMAAVQRAGGIAGFHDHERSFDPKHGKNLGLDITPGRLIFKKPNTFEESIDLFKQTVYAIRGTKTGKTMPLVWVFDSLASMIPQSQWGKEAAKQNMNDNSALSRATSNHFKVLAALAEELDVLLIFLNQTRTKIGVMFGDPTTTPGGDAPKFYVSIRIMLSAAKLTEGEGEDKEVIGSKVKAVIIKNKLNRPFLKAEWKFKFRPDGSGYFDVVDSLLDMLLAKKVLTSKSGRIEWVDGSKPYRRELIEKLTTAGPAGVKILEKMLIGAGIAPERDEEAVALAAAEEEIAEAA